MTRAYWTRQIDEIRKDRALQAYGGLLACVQALSAVYWLHTRVWTWLARGSEAICWPMFADCERSHVLGTEDTRRVIVGFLLASLVTASLFCSRRTLTAAYVSLCALNVVKLALLALDLRLRMNHHLMAFWVSVAFLFLPQKRRALKVLVVLFYLWAGALKLNPEWLSGSALYGELWLFHGPWIRWACAYVVVLELGFCWALWFDRSWAAWATLGQLVVFHTFSFPIVGFFYPTVMYAILAIYPLSWLLKPADAPPSVARGLLTRRELATTWGLALLFSGFQLLPRLLPGDTALTNEGRLFALNMFDARTECETFAKLHFRDGTERDVDLRLPLPIRLHCDPAVYLSRVRRMCRQGEKAWPGFVDLDWRLRSKRRSETKVHELVDLKSVCQQDLAYSPLFRNTWIRTD